MIIYRTAGAWGAGKGSNLTSGEVDENFYDHELRIAAIESDPPQAVSIVSFNVVGNQLTILMSDSTLRGPFTIPTAHWRFRGLWQPDTAYSVNDVVTDNGATYLVTYAHTSVSPFDAGATSGPGNDWYSLLLADPLPAGGTTGEVLMKASGVDGDVKWGKDHPAQTLDARIETADLVGNVPQYFLAPFAGEVEGLDVIVQATIGIGGTLTATVGGVSVGAFIQVVHGAVPGTGYSSDPSPRFPFNKGDVLAILPAFPNSPSPTAGALQVALRIVPD